MLTMSERVRDLRHRVAEIVGGVSGPQDYELDAAILAAFEEVARAAVEAERARVRADRAALFVAPPTEG